jgi:hypothetical protein
MKKEIQIKWSIHCCRKLLTDKKGGASMTVGYMTVIKTGRKNETIMHDSIFEALSHVEKKTMPL